MSETRTIECSHCHRQLEYPLEKEGTVNTCPHCHQAIWYSNLPEKSSAKSLLAATGTEAGKPARRSTWWLVFPVLAVLIWDNSRLRQDIHNLAQDLQSIQQQEEPETSSAGQRTGNPALARAEFNQQQLSAIVSEINAIETVVETKLSQLSSQSDGESRRIDALASSVASLGNDLNTLEFQIESIQTALTEIINSYSQLEASLATP